MMLYKLVGIGVLAGILGACGVDVAYSAIVDKGVTIGGGRTRARKITVDGTECIIAYSVYNSDSSPGISCNWSPK